MSVFLEHFSMWNMLNRAEQLQIQKQKMHAYKTLKNSSCPNNLPDECVNNLQLLKHPIKNNKKKINGMHSGFFKQYTGVSGLAWNFELFL